MALLYSTRADGCRCKFDESNIACFSSSSGLRHIYYMYTEYAVKAVKQWNAWMRIQCHMSHWLSWMLRLRCWWNCRTEGHQPRSFIAIECRLKFPSFVSADWKHLQCQRSSALNTLLRRFFVVGFDYWHSVNENAASICSLHAKRERAKPSSL
jgi:hypothetical protein